MSEASEEAAFVRLAADRPGDDGVRLVYADWLADRGRHDRAEFVRLQLALARLPADEPGRPLLQRRADELAAAHGRAWAGAVADITAGGYEFRRGFVEFVALPAKALAARGPELFRLAPVRRVRLLEPRLGLGDFLASPLAARVLELDFCGSDAGDLAASACARSTHLGRLEVLDLGYSGLSDAGLARVAECGRLPRLRRLDAACNFQVTSTGVRLLAAARGLGRLAELDLAGCDVGDPGLAALAASKALPNLAAVGLSGNHVGDAGLAALADSPLLERMLARGGVLELRSNGVGPAGAQALAASPAAAGLVTLVLDGNAVGDAGLAALARSPYLPRLRHLHLANNRVGPDGARALAASPLLGRLDRVDLTGNPIGAEGHEALTASPSRNWRTAVEADAPVVPPASR